MILDNGRKINRAGSDKMGIVQTLRKYGAGIYLGLILPMVGITITDWQFYAIIIPVIILVEWEHSGKRIVEEAETEGGE